MKALCKASMLMALTMILFLGPGAAYGAYPERPITLVCTSGVGSGIDLTLRFVAAVFEKRKLLLQPLTVENRTGGSGAVGMAYVASKKGDPYFLMGMTPIHLLTPLRQNSQITYKNLTPICNLNLDVHMLITNYNSKFKSIKEVVEYARANPETVTSGGTHVGGTESMNNWKLEQAAGIKLKYVSFGGGDATMTALLGGHIDLAFGNPSELLELIKAKKIRVLGVLTEKRLANLPEYPTIKEQGYNAVGAPVTRGIGAPADIPEDAYKVLEEAFLKFSQTEDFKKWHRDNIIEEYYMNGKEFGKFLEERTDDLRATLKGMGLLK